MRFSKLIIILLPRKFSTKTHGGETSAMTDNANDFQMKGAAPSPRRTQTQLQSRAEAIVNPASGLANDYLNLFNEIVMLIEQLPPGCSMTLAWGALLHDVGKPPTFRRAPDRIRFDGHVEIGVAIAAEICRGFRFSNEETRQVLALVENHMRFMDAPRMKASTLKRFFRLDRFDEHLALHRMDCLAASGNLEHWEFVRERFSSMPEEAVRPQPLITGRELIAAGYAPGAGFREMLRAAEDAQLEGTVTTAEEALQLLRERFLS